MRGIPTQTCVRPGILSLPSLSPTYLVDAGLQAYRCLGRVEDSYLDLQEVSQACPDHPGILDLLQQAAQLCLTRQARLTGDGAWQVTTPVLQQHEIGTYSMACLESMPLHWFVTSPHPEAVPVDQPC